MSQKITIFVTQEHINQGVRMSGESCPVALAIRETLTTMGRGDSYINVAANTIGLRFDNVREWDRLLVSEYPTPPGIADFVENFDWEGAKAVTPTAFDLVLPSDVHFHAVTAIRNNDARNQEAVN